MMRRYSAKRRKKILFSVESFNDIKTFEALFNYRKFKRIFRYYFIIYKCGGEIKTYKYIIKNYKNKTIILKDFKSIDEYVKLFDGIIIGQPFSPFNRNLIFVAKRNQIKTFYIPHGLFTKKYEFMKNLPKKILFTIKVLKEGLNIAVKFGTLKEYIISSARSFISGGKYGYIICDYIFVYDKIMKKWLGGSKNIIVSGNPRFDTIKNIKMKSNTYKKLKNSKIILYLHQPFFEDNILSLKESLTYIKDLINIANELKYTLLIKLHPRTSGIFIKNLRAITKNKKNVYIIDYSGLNLYSCIMISDVVIGVSSTAMIEAALIGKRTYIYNPFRLMEMPLYNRLFKKYYSKDKIIMAIKFDKDKNKKINSEFKIGKSRSIITNMLKKIIN